MPAPKRDTTQNRYQELRNFVDHRYSVDRIRYDDVLLEACQKFYYKLSQVQKIMKQA
jgi:hypothetical protein